MVRLSEDRPSYLMHSLSPSPSLSPPPLSQHTEKVDFSFNSLADPRFVFHDHSLVEEVKLENPEVHAFFRLLALCHTVMAEEKREGEGGRGREKMRERERESIRYEGLSSDIATICKGVPQGFVLGPLTVCINNLDQNVVDANRHF